MRDMYKFLEGHETFGLMAVRLNGDVKRRNFGKLTVDILGNGGG